MAKKQKQTHVTTTASGIDAMFEGSSVLVVEENGQVWFKAKDVCDVLGYKNDTDALQDHCKKDGVAFRYSIDTINRKQRTTFINEANLYRLIFKSKKPAAERFEAFVMEELLPTVRKTGKFDIAESSLASKKTVTPCNSDPLAIDGNLMAKLLHVFDRQYERAEIAMALVRAGALDDYVQLSMREIEELTNYSVSVASVHRAMHLFEELGALFVHLEKYKRSYMLNRKYLEYKLSEIEDKENIPPSFLLALDYPELLS